MNPLENMYRIVKWQNRGNKPYYFGVYNSINDAALVIKTQAHHANLNHYKSDTKRLIARHGEDALIKYWTIIETDNEFGSNEWGEIHP
jgi:hypothetical protein